MLYERKLALVHDTSGLFGGGDFTDRPCPAITCGVDAINRLHYQVYVEPTDWTDSDIPMGTVSGKPVYRVPSMREIAASPLTGLTAASTFSGCGGSSLGYRMAGFRVGYANEFIPAARDTYAANFPNTVLDDRDIRLVMPNDILDACGVRQGELDLLDGSPPCASFSSAGAADGGWGQVKPYSDSCQRTDDLFLEFARILRGVQPRTFVAENVSGLIRGPARGMFLEFMAELRSAGYNVRTRLLDAQYLGVPQARPRLIFQGVRLDIPYEPAHPRPFGYTYSMRECLPMVRPYQPQWEPASLGGPQPLPWEDLRGLRIRSRAENRGEHVRGERRQLTIGELKRICAFPDDFVLTGTREQQWERCARAVPPLMMRAVAETVRDMVLVPHQRGEDAPVRL